MSSAIADFYKHQTVLVTGGTGFVGKLLVEKLLRTCGDIDRIYLLVRPKRGKSDQERFEKIFSFPCFDRLKGQGVVFKEKVTLISGDCALEHLGIDKSDRETLEKSVTCVIHAAADVRFDNDLKKAVYNNVRPVRDLLDLAGKMPKLKSFVYISTAFSNCHVSHIKEEFYEPPMGAKRLTDLVENVDEETMRKVTPFLVEKWQNTYVYTKAVAEDLVREKGKGMPVAIVRPAIITNSAAEPMPGWIDNFYGPIGFLVGFYLGIIRCVRIKLDKNCDFAPVDYVTNFILAVAWKIHEDRASTNSETQVRIFNYAGSNSNQFTWQTAYRIAKAELPKIPSNRRIWHHVYVMLENKFLYDLSAFLLHTVPAYIVDLILFLVGKKAIAVKGFKKFHKLADITAHFRIKEWYFDDGNWKNLWMQMSEADREKFNFNIDTLDWIDYFKTTMLGLRLYLVKDPMETLEKAKVRYKILQAVHYAVLTVLGYFMFKLVLSIVGFVF